MKFIHMKCESVAQFMFIIQWIEIVLATWTVTMKMEWAVQIKTGFLSGIYCLLPWHLVCGTV